MKTVFFIRHAKSSWADMSLRDIHRPLNKRGLRDAPFMAKALAAKGVKVDLILSSPANRALTTAKYFAQEQGIDQKEISIENAIYEAYPETIIQLLKETSPEVNTIFIFGHNPTFTSIANYYSGTYIPNVPTCGIIKVETAIDSWQQFSKNNGNVTGFYYPKQYFS